VTRHVQPERAPPQRSRGTRRGLALSLASTVGRERQHHQRTAPPSTSTSPPRPARRKHDEAAPQAQRDDEIHGLLGSAGLMRWSPLPPEKQGNDGANPKAWIWPEQTRASPPKQWHKSHNKAKKQQDLHLRPSAPPCRRSRPASLAGTTPDRAGSLVFPFGHCSEVRD
jgi:hypothetical protein